MSAEQVTNIILGIVVAIPSVMAFLAARKAGRAAGTAVAAVVEVDKKVDANTAITAKVAVVAEETKRLADGNLTKALGEIDRLRVILESVRDNSTSWHPPTGPGTQSTAKPGEP
jgi:hypothetical protein